MSVGLLSRALARRPCRCAGTRALLFLRGRNGPFLRNRAGSTSTVCGLVTQPLGAVATSTVDEEPPAESDAALEVLLDSPLDDVRKKEEEGEAEFVDGERSLSRNSNSSAPGKPKQLRFLVGKRWKTLQEAEQSLQHKWSLWMRRGLLPREEEEEEGEGHPNEEGEEEEGGGRADIPPTLINLKNVSTLSHRSNLPQTMELVQHLQEKLSLQKGHLRLYQRTLPSLFGTSKEWVDRRVEELRGVGFSENEVNFILPLFPPPLRVDLANVRAVYSLFKKFSFSRIWINGLMKRHTHIFLLDTTKVEKQLQTLKDTGLTSREMATLLFQFPILVSAPLSSDATAVIDEAQEVGFGHKWLSQSLAHSLHLRPAKFELGTNCREVLEILQAFGVDHNSLLIRCPHFFEINAQLLTAVLCFLMGHPLYLDTRDIQCILISVPDIISKISDTESFRKELEGLGKYFPSNHDLHRAISLYPGILGTMSEVEEKVRVMSEVGLSPADRAYILGRASSILLQSAEEELRPRLHFLFSLPGVTPTSLREVDPSCLYTLLTTHLDTLKAKYNYAMENNESLVDALRLRELFCSPDKELAEMCGKPLLHFQQAVGHLQQRGSRRRGRPRQSHPQGAATKLSVLELDTTTGRGEIQDAKSGGVASADEGGAPVGADIPVPVHPDTQEIEPGESVPKKRKRGRPKKAVAVADEKGAAAALQSVSSRKRNSNRSARTGDTAKKGRSSGGP